MKKIYYNRIIEVTDDDSYRYRIEVDDDFTYIIYEEFNKEYGVYKSVGQSMQIPTYLAMKVADGIKELGRVNNPEPLWRIDP